MGSPPDDKDEFRRAVAGVKPLAGRKRVALGKKRAATARRRPAEERFDFIGSTEPRFLRPGYGSDVLRNLRRGYWPIEEELDLHGLTRQQAGREIVRLVARSLRCALIVHGKGHGSEDGDPILRTLVRGLLSRREEVVAYCEAPADLGGAGATLVLLKA